MKKLQISVMFLMLTISTPVNCLAQSQGVFVEEQETSENNSQVATANEMSAPIQVVEEGMVPVYPEDILEGEYEIEVDSSSSMFNITKCQLTVKDGKMKAVMTMGGKGYLCVYLGTGEEAIDAPEEEYIRFVETTDGKHTFEVPVEALDKGIDCAAFSKNKKKWYDRVIVFKASSLPKDALLNIKKTEIEDLSLEDGEYEIEAELKGGSGHTKLENPCKLFIKEQEAVAKITIASKNYDYIRIGDMIYNKINAEGNSVFEIPIDAFDYDMAIKVNNVALGKPVEMDFSICFHSETIKK